MFPRWIYFSFFLFLLFLTYHFSLDWSFILKRKRSCSLIFEIDASKVKLFPSYAKALQEKLLAANYHGTDLHAYLLCIRTFRSWRVRLIGKPFASFPDFFFFLPESRVREEVGRKKKVKSFWRKKIKVVCARLKLTRLL